MRISYSTIKALIHYALIYLLLTLNGAMIFVQNRNLILYFVVLLYGALCVLFNSSGKYNKKEPLLYVAFLLFFVFFVRVVSGGIGIDSWLLYTGQVLIVYLCCYFNRDEFLNRFVILTVVMAAVSILCFMVQIFDRTLLLNLLKAESYVPLSDGRVFSYKGILLYTLPTHIESMRNTSFYSEPGRVQAMLHGALFCCLFMQPYLKLSSKKIIACVVILVIAVLTTQSATGYIGLLILLIGFLIRKPDRLRKIYDSKLKRKIIFFVFLIVIFLLVDYIRNGSASIIGTIVVGKISDTDIYDTASSGGARLRMLEAALQQITSKPWGSGTFSVSGNTAAGGLIRYIAVMGIVPGVVFLYWLIKPFVKKHTSLIEIMVYLAVYINIGIGQSYAYYPTLLVIPIALSYCAPNYNHSDNIAEQI